MMGGRLVGKSPPMIPCVGKKLALPVQSSSAEHRYLRDHHTAPSSAPSQPLRARADYADGKLITLTRLRSHLRHRKSYAQLAC